MTGSSPAEHANCVFIRKMITHSWPKGCGREAFFGDAVVRKGRPKPLLALPDLPNGIRHRAAPTTGDHRPCHGEAFSLRAILEATGDGVWRGRLGGSSNGVLAIR